jgi:hypothetical protein
MPTLSNDHRRQFHNEIGWVVGNFARTASTTSTRKPQNMFESGIPAEHYALWQASGGLQNIVPDLAVDYAPPLVRSYTS